VKALKYIRFETLVPNPDTGLRAGLFFHLYDLLDNPDFSASDFERIAALRKWFNKNLKRPKKFSSSKSKGAARRGTRGLSWFKPDASDHLAYARQLAAVLREYGYEIQQRETTSPGKIIYEDDHQIVAEPFSDRK
jgi:hypothetical protein